MKPTDDELKKRLNPEQYRVTQQKGTELPFTGIYNNSKEPGVYRCVVCDNVLFDSDNKFDSGTGWPSFDRPMDPEAVGEKEDSNLLMHRTEVVCRHCGAHLGHVFNDGPEETTGMRYCINSAALKLDPKTKK